MHGYYAYGMRLIEIQYYGRDVDGEASFNVPSQECQTDIIR